MIRTTCAIVGGGPAGMMLGYLLARAGVDVVVLEKHADFLRDFRGDTIHPSTLEVLDEVGLLDEFLERPQQKMDRVSITFGKELVQISGFDHLPTKCKFIAFTPQWEFLDFLADAARLYPHFHLLMSCEAQDLLMEQERVVGVLASAKEGPLEIRADLVVACDGRNSVLRQKAGLKVQEYGVPIDVLWMRIPKPPNTPTNSLGYIDGGKFLVLIDRGDYYQCAVLIPKGTLPQIREEGLEAFQNRILAQAPFLKDAVGELNDWDKLKLLTVRIDRLERWHRPGLLCIGDCAHAMSPAGGIGINLAIQDAVATANLLAEKLLAGKVSDNDLTAVQLRREPPTVRYQRVQVFLHRFVINPQGSAVALWVFKALVKNVPAVGRRIARTIGVGFLPEHVHSPVAPKH